MRARLVNEARGQIYNKQQVIELILSGEYDEVKDIMRSEIATLSKEEFNKMAQDAGLESFGKYWATDTIQKN
jgi:lactate dehydrogenase-like 2-hydroxyacid dehydrogenase